MSYNKETRLYEGYLYLITCKVNNKQYIGQTTTTVENRFMEHCQKADTDVNYFHNAILKYGKENFNVITLDSITSDNPENLSEILNKGEIFYIAKYNTVVPNGYNLTNGGGNTSIRFQKPVCQYSFDGKYIKTYESATIASEKLGINRKCISNCCNKKVSKNGKHTYSAGGYIWRFEGDSDISDALEHINKHNKRICKYTMNNELVCIYENIDVAISDIEDGKYARNGIKKCCDNVSYSYYGYRYAYEGNKPCIGSTVSSVNQYDLDGNLLNTYISIEEAKLSVGNCHISACCNKKCKTAGGYIWRFVNDALTDYDIEQANNKESVNRIRISQYTKDGKYVNTYNSISEAALFLGDINKVANISCCCKGSMSTAYGFVWCYEDSIPNFELKEKRHTEVIQFDTDGNFIKKFHTIAEAAKSVGLKTQSSISLCCSGINKTAGSYVWQYA